MPESIMLWRTIIFWMNMGCHSWVREHDYMSFKPDVIIVNACDARGKRGRLIMNAGDVKKTCDCKPDSIVIASHMDAVSHAHLSRDQLKKELACTRYAEQVLIPVDGERIEII